MIENGVTQFISWYICSIYCLDINNIPNLKSKVSTFNFYFLSTRREKQYTFVYPISGYAP